MKCRLGLSQKHIVAILWIFNTAIITRAKIFTLEIENFAPATMRMPRSGASGSFTVLMKNGDNVHIEFCLRVATFVKVRNVVFSNDGDADKIRTSVDGRHTGTFQSREVLDHGNGWNSFLSSGPLDGKAMLDIGRHIITLSATTDQWGVEIDNVVLVIGDELLQAEDLLCNLFCFDINYDDEQLRQNFVSNGRFVQKSVSTKCSEQDNVQVQIFHNTATNFDIVATLPKYLSFANHRKPAYGNCVLSRPYWVFRDKSVSPTQHNVTSSSGATLSFGGSRLRTVLTLTFNLKTLTPTREMDERLIGSILHLKLRNLSRQNVRVRLEYLKDNEWVSHLAVEFTPFANHHTWSFPDRTWDILKDNVIRLHIEPGLQQVIVDTVKLESRDSSDSTVDLYADSNIVYQAVRLGFWDHWGDSPESMTLVILDVNGSIKTHYKIDSLRIYVKVPWTGGYSQVFVLYQNGRVRIQTVTPHGLDYVPFGSSVNIGQPDSINSQRPYSPIQKITIFPTARQMDIRYKNGNKATLILETSLSETTVGVRNCTFRKNRRTYPLLTFKSMWVKDGNSNADHVTINGHISRHIMTKWRTLYGNTAVFFRKCISSHNTQAPDIAIKIL